MNEIGTKLLVSNVKETIKVYFEQCNSKMTFRLKVRTCSVNFFVDFRLGIQSVPVLLKDTEEEVNDYLGRAIDARSIDRLRATHCKVRWL